MIRGWRPVARLAVRRVLLGGWRTVLVIGLVAVAVGSATAVLGAQGGNDSAGDVVSPFAVGISLLVVTAGLASGERDRVRAAAVLSCNGARRFHQRVARVVEAFLLGLLGTLAGIGLGVLVRVAAGRVTTSGDLRGAIAIALATTLVGALAASRRAPGVAPPSRLKARRPTRPVRPAKLALAVGLVLIGTFFASASRDWLSMALLVPVGGLLVAVGVALLASMSLALLAPVAVRAHGAGRLAALGLSRDRARTGPVAALVAVACGVAFVAAILGTSFDRREDRRREALARLPWAERLHDDQVLLRVPELYLLVPELVGGPDDGLAAELVEPLRPVVPDGSAVAEVRTVVRSGTAGASQLVTAWRPPGLPDGGGPTSVALADGALLDALGIDPVQRRPLAEGRALVLDPRLVHEGAVRLDAGSDRSPLVVPAVAGERERARADLPAVLLPPSALGDPSLRPWAIGVLVRVPGGVTRALEERVAAVLSPTEAAWRAEHGVPDSGYVLELVTPGSSAEWETGRLNSNGLVPDEDGVRRLAGSGFLAAVAVIIFAVALATVDRRVDDELLTVLGAPARLRRIVAGLQAATLAAIGAGLAVAIGTVATAVGFGAYNDADTGPPPIPFVFPWTVALLLLVALPLAAATLTSLLTPTIRSVDLHRLAD